MATYAYRDAERTDPIFASVVENRDERFYCPNPHCTAHLHICAVNGSKKAYFRATKRQFSHIHGCIYGLNSMEFDKDQFEETLFDFEETVNAFCSDSAAKHKTVKQRDTLYRNGCVKAHPPRTLRQVYQMCKNYPVNDTYNGKQISEMILDDRSEYRYPK